MRPLIIRHLPDKILLLSPSVQEQEGKNAAWLYLATFRVINGDFINDRDGGQGLWTGINSKLINGICIIYIYICNGKRTTPRAAASLAIQPRFIVHRRRKSNSGQLN